MTFESNHTNENKISDFKYCCTCLSSNLAMKSIHEFGHISILQQIGVSIIWYAKCYLIFCKNNKQYCSQITPCSNKIFTWICYKCQHHLRNFEKFKSLCMKADNIIKKIGNHCNEKVLL